MKYELHHLCTLFPRLSGKEFESLCADIKENGLRNPIVVHEGMILDGGNRYRACIELGIKPDLVEFTGGNIVSFVLSANLHRRHLSPGQQAAIVASAQDWANAHTHGGDRKSEQSRLNDFDTVDKRAAASGVHRDTQIKADKVAKADPDLAKKVAHGEISLPKAVKQITPQKNKTQKKTQEEDKEKEQIQQELYGDAEIDPTAELEAAHKEIERLTQIIESDDQLAEANKEIKRLASLCETQQYRINSLMSEKAEAVRYAKKYKSMLDSLEKKVSKADLVDF